MRYRYKTKGTCSTEISFDINGNVITDISFKNGCNGNQKMISKLVDGMSVDEIESKCLGNLCGTRGTSCADQLAKAVRAAANETAV